MKKHKGGVAAIARTAFKTAFGAAFLAAAAVSAAVQASGNAPTSAFTFNSRTAVPLANCPSVTGRTSSWCSSNWPPNADGTVYLYKFTETRLVASTYATLTRTAYVYRPAAIVASSKVPLLVYLHGGTQTGDLMFEQTPFAQLADARGTSASYWYQNSASCQQSALGPKSFLLGGTSALGFVDSSGAQCTATLRHFARPSSAGAFFVAFPNGIPDVDGGGDSWEDGRNPSPGQYDAANPNDQKRDDVGFINALIATIKTQESSTVNTSRVYVAGLSNGGIMTHRLVCNGGNANYPELGKVAAFSMAISSMADNIYSGTNGREQCSSSGSTPVPLALFVGYGAPTPDSNGQAFTANCNPYNPGNPVYPHLPACPYATVPGDGTMPYGSGYDTGGGTYTVNSPTIGNVIASWDDQSYWLNFLQSAGAGGSSAASGIYGYFTHYRHYAFSNTPAVLQVYEIDHGLHGNGGTRFDYSAGARVYDFLFEFSKTGGVVSTTGGAYSASTGTYGNLTGNY